MINNFKFKYLDETNMTLLFDTSESVDKSRELNYDIDGLVYKDWAERIER